MTSILGKNLDELADLDARLEHVLETNRVCRHRIVLNSGAEIDQIVEKLSVSRDVELRLFNAIAIGVDGLHLLLSLTCEVGAEIIAVGREELDNLSWIGLLGAERTSSVIGMIRVSGVGAVEPDLKTAPVEDVSAWQG